MSPDLPHSTTLAVPVEREERSGEFTDKHDRLLGYTVFLEDGEVTGVEAWDDSGKSVYLDPDTVDAIVMKEGCS